MFARLGWRYGMVKLVVCESEGKGGNVGGRKEMVGREGKRLILCLLDARGICDETMGRG